LPRSFYIILISLTVSELSSIWHDLAHRHFLCPIHGTVEEEEPFDLEYLVMTQVSLASGTIPLVKKTNDNIRGKHRSCSHLNNYQKTIIRVFTKARARIGIFAFGDYLRDTFVSGDTIFLAPKNSPPNTHHS